MYIYKFYLLLFAIKTATCSCSYEHRAENFEIEKVDIEKVGEFPSLINESSGLIKANENGKYWTHNDGGGKPQLYMVDAEGLIYETLEIPNADNKDWEDLAKDTKGNIYIGDFGNNNNKRKDLVIYKKGNLNVEKLTFRYSDQDFKDNKDLSFDCEAFFWANDSLYLFTKSWAKGKKISKLYVMPDKPGDYTLKPQDSVWLKSQVTGADISPDGTKYVLITYGKLFLYGIKNGKINFGEPLTCFKIGKNQTEAVVFENDHKIIFSNEQGKIYQIEI
ncbi:hypothetical protein [Lacihabitans lacunae]|uniref:SMP-30/Gluconolactonase/LRE-like region domain-containing protein n=1 Tax=Lacihabitans lacunae TaxID=1028214 RepID=A0ABV7YUZ5_9BACT